jgi:hypothetical protein
VRQLIHRARKRNMNPPSRTADGDLLSEAVEALRCQVTNTTNKLHAKRGPDSVSNGCS